jgi:hypothetical protein
MEPVMPPASLPTALRESIARAGQDQLLRFWDVLEASARELPLFCDAHGGQAAEGGRLRSGARGGQGRQRRRRRRRRSCGCGRGGRLRLQLLQLLLRGGTAGRRRRGRLCCRLREAQQQPGYQ